MLKKINLRFSWYRIIIFVTGFGSAFTCYWFDSQLSWLLVGVTMVIFNIVAYFHRRIEKHLKEHEIWLELKQEQIARINLDWQNIPRHKAEPDSSEHPFEIDLDITGEKSLHHLLDISISQNGSSRLKQWLLQQIPQPQVIFKRQQIVTELKRLSLFRDKLRLNFRLVARERLEGSKILGWLKQTPPVTTLKWISLALLLVAAVNWTLLFLFLMELADHTWIFLSLAFYAGIYFWNKRHLDSLLQDSQFIDAELKKSVAIFRFLERYSYRDNQHLARLCEPFLDHKNRPTAHLRRLTRIMIAIGLRMNYILGLLLNVAGPWDYFWALRMNQVKSKLAEQFPGWLEICFELEALISLANFADLNPEYNFPEIIAEKAGNSDIHFQAVSLGHPLIPPRQKIQNDFALNHLGEIVLVTGSNMAGKSTFLRTIGINLCLAYAGAPVNAAIFKISLFRIFSCIRVNDSLTGGISQFYAEVKRLKVLLDYFSQASGFPVFFLIDEIYRGTNNRERLIGSRSYIRALLGQHGTGLVSTHDLELTNLADNFPDLKNFHFREEVIHGKMEFDYKLHPGPCPTTNALKIMKLEGLPVDDSVGGE